MSMAGLKYYLSDPKHLFDFFASRGLLNWMSDEKYLKLKFKNDFGYAPDLDEPKTFNEKLQWLKLHDRKPLYTRLADKYEVRSYIAEKIGEEYLIPLVGGPWDSADEIDFDSLPERFVLKCTHDSGGVLICRDKSLLDVNHARKFLTNRMKRNYYWSNREWPYKDIRPRIIAEQYIEEAGRDLVDYKLVCFNSEAKLCQLHLSRYSGHTQNFYDRDWVMQDFSQGLPRSNEKHEKPENYEKMIELSELLTQDMACARVDWYSVGTKLYFGEITFYDGAGTDRFQPAEWDEILGSWIKLPDIN